MRLFRIALINVFVLAIMLLTLNLIASAILDYRGQQRTAQDGSKDRRVSLPAYENKEYAKEIYRDFYRTKTSYSSYEEFRLEEFSSKTVNIDKYGIRHTVGQPPAAKGYIRFFGGSTMWGTGSDDQGTIPSLVQKDFPEYKVVNHGQSGFLSGQSLVSLLKLIRSGEPLGVVVFYDGVNDIFHQCVRQGDIEDTGFSPLIRDLLENRKGNSATKYFFNASIGNLVKLVLGQDIKKAENVNEIPAAACSKDPARVEEIARRQVANWNIAKQLVENNGGKFVAILQPVSSVGSPKRDYLPQTKEWDEWYQGGYDVIRKNLKKVNSAYDLSDSFDGNEAVYVDWCHVTANGNAIVAARIGKLLRPVVHPSWAGAE